MKQIFRSKIFLIALIAVLVIAAAAFMLAGKSDVGKPLDAGTAAEVLEGKAEILLDFGTWAEIEIINGEKGYFAVREGSKDPDRKSNKPYKIVDAEGNILLEPKMNQFDEPAGDYIMMNNGGKWNVLNRQTLEVTETGLLEASVHRSGRYVSGRAVREAGSDYEDQDWYVISLEDGSVLYEGRNPLTLPYHEGYVMEAVAGGLPGNTIISLETGETVFEAGMQESVADDTDGYWLVWSRWGLKYFLDENFQPAFGGQLFLNATLYDGLAFGQWIEDGMYTNVSQLPQENGLPPVGALDVSIRAFNKEYEERWNYMDAPAEWIGNFENYLCVWDAKNQLYEYVDLRQNDYGPASFAEGYLCFKDNDDGYMLACAETVRSDKPIKPDTALSDYFKEDYRWGYVDTEEEVFIDFGLLGASLSENGYAVVENEEGQVALIRLGA